MLLDHDGIHGRCVGKGQEAETSRSSRLRVMHDCTMGHFAKLLEILSHLLCKWDKELCQYVVSHATFSSRHCLLTFCRFPIEPTDKHLAIN